MLENIKKVDNPLTVIAIFAGVAEVADAVALPFIDAHVQATFVWFLMGFPVLLVLAFFVTLNWNHKVLYAPSDYRDDSSFLRVLGSGATNLSELRLTAPAALASSPTLLGASPNQPITQFTGVPAKINAAVNHAFTKFGEKSKALFADGSVSAISLSPQGSNFFLLQVDLKIPEGNTGILPREPRIIEVKEKDDTVELGVVGKSYTSSTPDEFAELLFNDISETVSRRNRS